VHLKVAKSKYPGSRRLQSAFCQNLKVAATILQCLVPSPLEGKGLGEGGTNRIFTLSLVLLHQGGGNGSEAIEVKPLIINLGFAKGGRSPLLPPSPSEQGF